MSSPRQPKIGRPRIAKARLEGEETTTEILDAAAELFTSVGFKATSTRALAEAVGVRQATLYHYFPNKNAILLELLISTVKPSVDLCRHLLDDPRRAASPEDVLRELIVADALLLLTDKWNTALLYESPEVDGDSFAEFHALRSELKSGYAQLAREVVKDRNPSASSFDTRLSMPFHIVESIVRLRREQKIPEDRVVEIAQIIGDSALATLLGSS